MSQKNKTLGIYRQLAFFACCNSKRYKEVTAHVRLLNGPDPATAPVTDRLFKENPGLTVSDIRKFTDWLLAQGKVNSKDLSGQLQTLRRRRLLKWHVMDSPADVVIPSLSMHLSVAFAR